MLIRKVIDRLQYIFFPTEHQKILNKWYADGGDVRFRFNYDLTSDSLVFDIGGYEGRWASDIYSRYCCRVFVFEPVSEFAEQIQTRFLRNPNIKVLQFGLGKNSRTEVISICGDGSSIFRNSNKKQKIQIVDVAEWIESHGITEIDLMKVNIEGGEYELLERLIETDLIRIVRNIQVQFHKIERESSARMERIQERLRETHYLTYQYKFCWENWVRTQS
jgi:FkbM family methyltransferase